MGLAQLAYDWGLQVSIKIYVDSAAAIGVARRRGNGKLRHVRVGDLWIQELVEEEEIRLKKIFGTQNVADAFTKYLAQAVMDNYLRKMNMEFREGRAASGLQVQCSVK